MLSWSPSQASGQYFSEEGILQQIFKCNLNLFMKLITITSIIEKYLNKNKINFNHNLIYNYRIIE